jgi:hypothetical protein
MSINLKALGGAYLMTVRITAIRKDNGNHDNPHEAISMFRWVDERTDETGDSTRLAMVDWLENKGGTACVGTGAYRARCYVNVSVRGNKFLQTQADGRWSNNLLSLPEF